MTAKEALRVLIKHGRTRFAGPVPRARALGVQLADLLEPAELFELAEAAFEDVNGHMESAAIRALHTDGSWYRDGRDLKITLPPEWEGC